MTSKLGRLAAATDDLPLDQQRQVDNHVLGGLSVLVDDEAFDRVLAAALRSVNHLTC